MLGLILDKYWVYSLANNFPFFLKQIDSNKNVNYLILLILIESGSCRVQFEDRVQLGRIQSKIDQVKSRVS